MPRPAYPVLGDYHPPGPWIPGRWLFLKALAREAPEALDELAALASADDPPTWTAVRAWTERWHIAAPWMCDVAWDTAQRWRRDPKARRWRHWQKPALAYGEPSGLRVDVTFVDDHPVLIQSVRCPQDPHTNPPPALRWDPVFESEADFRKRVEAAIRQGAKWARARAGLIEAPRFDAVVRKKLPAWLRVLVRWQVRRLPLERACEILTHTPTKPAALRARLRQLARLIDLPLTIRPGRPRRLVGKS